MGNYYCNLQNQAFSHKTKPNFDQKSILMIYVVCMIEIYYFLPNYFKELYLNTLMKNMLDLDTFIRYI